MTNLSYLLDTSPHRFDLTPNRPSMKAVVTTGNGGYDKLDFRDVPLPQIGPGEVLLKVLAAGVNNTEINTRLGWYSSSVTSGTEQFSDSGRDGEIADSNSALKLGDRVLVRACMRLNGFDSIENIWMASDFDGAFAQYVKVPASEVFAVSCGWSDVELATIPCAYGTAENMVHRARVSAGDRVFVTGASGGVGSAVVQLAKRRGAHVTAVTSPSKVGQVEALGADRVLLRNADLIGELGESAVDIVIDNVAGEGFPTLLKLMARGGRYASSGAIAGPMVNMDMRDFYLKDLTLIGCTAWDEPVFPNLVGYIERGEIKPLVDQTYPLEEIAAAQQAFMKKTHVGNFVLIPPSDQKKYP